MTGRFALGVLSYVVPTFALAVVWHVFAFGDYYKALGIYRPDMIFPMGFGSMLIQAVLFSFIYQKAFGSNNFEAGRVLRFGLLGAALSWSFTTLAVGAKHIMNSVPDYLLIESAFTVTQWVIVAPLMALALRGSALNVQRSIPASG